MFPDLWKTEILSGMLPAKTSQYLQKEKRKEIIYLFDSIEEIQCIGIKRNQVKKALTKYQYVLNELYEQVLYLNRIGIKPKVIYFPWNRPRFRIKRDDKKLKVFIPICLEDEEKW